jgi:catechol 2,3-dioxygenase-like lactoylglutathione lyase family enzyme
MNKLDHIAIIVDRLDAGIAFYRDVVRLGEPVVVEVPELGIRCAFFDPGRDGVIVELVEFSGTSDLAHGDVVVAVEVGDLDEAIQHFRGVGVKAYDQPPTENLPLRRGWVLKKDGHGTVIELCLPGEVARFVRSHPAPV